MSKQHYNAECYRQRYLKNKVAILARTKKYRLTHAANYKKYILKSQTKKRTLVNTFKSKPCTDCNVQYPPCVMQFDHVTADKCFDIAGHSGYGTAKVLHEITKCEVVCANCHALRTEYRRKQSGK